MAGRGKIAAGIVMLILGVIITGIGFAITNQCQSFRGQLGTFLDSNNQAACGIADFGLIVGVFIGIVGLILLIVGAIQHGIKRKKAVSVQSDTLYYRRPNYNRNSISPSMSNRAEKIYCRYCGKERRNTGDFCSVCGRSSHTNSSAMKQCQVCEAMMSEDSKFCGNCSIEFQQSTSESVTEKNGDVSSSCAFKIFEEPQLGIKMWYPIGWRTEVTKDWIVFYPQNEKELDKDVSGFWVIRDNNFNHTIEGYVKEKINRISSEYENFKLLESNNNATLSGKPAYKLVYIRSSKNLTTITKRIEIGTTVRGKVYYVNGGSEGIKYSKYLPVIERMISSVELTKIR